MPKHHSLDAPEVLSLLQQWEVTPDEDAAALVTLLDKLLHAPHPEYLRSYPEQPLTEGEGLAPALRYTYRYRGARAHYVMVTGAFPHMLEKVRRSVRSPAGVDVFTAWTDAVLAEPDDAVRPVPSTLRSLLVAHLRPDLAWSKREIKHRMPVLPDLPHLAADLIANPARSAAFRSDLLIHMFGSTASDQLPLLHVMGAPGVATLLDHPPLRRFLWKKVHDTVARATFSASAMTSIFNLLVETADDVELVPLVGSAIAASRNGGDTKVLAEWARVLVGLEVAGRLAPLLPPETTFQTAYAALLPVPGDGEMYHYAGQGREVIPLELVGAHVARIRDERGLRRAGVTANDTPAPSTIRR